MCHPSLIQVTDLDTRKGKKMDKVYRVRFTNWKDGNNEYFYANKKDAQELVIKYEKYGYLATLETIFLVETSSMVNA